MAAQLVTRLRHFVHCLPAKALGSGGTSSGLARPVPPQAATLLRALSTHTQESFMSGSNSVYVEEMYRAWLKNKESVHKSWDVYFTALESGQTEVGERNKQESAKATHTHSFHPSTPPLFILLSSLPRNPPRPPPSNRMLLSQPPASKPPSPPPPPPWPPASSPTPSA